MRIECASNAHSMSSVDRPLVSRKYCELKICDTQLLCLGGNSVVLNIFECFILPFFSKIGELKTATRFRDII